MRFLLILLFLPFILFSQKRKKSDVVSNVEIRGMAMKAFGNNTFAKDLVPFAGFGIGGNLITPINFGIGADYNKLFSNVKYGHEVTYGYLGPKADNLDIYLTHRDEISENFYLEELLGYSYFGIKSKELEGNNYYKQTSNGINFGGKLIYNLDRNGYQQFALTAKAHSFSSGKTYRPDYYNKTFLLSFSFAYRYQF